MDPSPNLELFKCIMFNISFIYESRTMLIFLSQNLLLIFHALSRHREEICVHKISFRKKG